MPNKKNDYNPPKCTDKRKELVAVGCGRCIECMKQKRRNWQLRLCEELKISNECKFVTLTFSNEWFNELRKEFKGVQGYALDNSIATLAVRRFLERWRKEHGKSVRHWLVTELGQDETERIHLHGIIWNRDLDKIERIWKYGHVWKGKRVNEILLNYVNEKTINYLIKYVGKIDLKHREYKSIVLCSKGIGANFIDDKARQYNKFNGEKTREYYVNKQGFKIGLPIYWRNKLWTEEEREKLWTQKLDENIRFVMGAKFKVEKDYEKFLNVQKYYQRINEEAGYGNDIKDWSSEQYENELRVIKHYRMGKK